MPEVRANDLFATHPPIQRAAKNDVISLNDGPMNVNSEPKPRMMPIKDLA
jgi:hypothetical protein